MPVSVDYLNDQLAQRWSTNPVWIEEECPYSWREAGIMFMRAESEAQKTQRSAASSDGPSATVNVDGVPESVQTIRARRLAEIEAAKNGEGDW